VSGTAVVPGDTRISTGCVSIAGRDGDRDSVIVIDRLVITQQYLAGSESRRSRRCCGTGDLSRLLALLAS